MAFSSASAKYYYAGGKSAEQMVGLHSTARRKVDSWVHRSILLPLHYKESRVSEWPRTSTHLGFSLQSLGEEEALLSQFIKCSSTHAIAIVL